MDIFVSRDLIAQQAFSAACQKQSGRGPDPQNPYPYGSAPHELWSTELESALRRIRGRFADARRGQLVSDVYPFRNAPNQCDF